jgi:hypothetical protein
MIFHIINGLDTILIDWTVVFFNLLINAWEIMVSTLALIVSIFALVVTWRQLYIQRKHNENSLKPLGQIDLGDYNKHTFVYLINYGLGPLIIKKLSFNKMGIEYSRITDCLEIDSKTYMHIDIDNQQQKIVLPGKYIEIFETKFVHKPNTSYNGQSMINLKRQLSGIFLTVYYSDIYNNNYTICRDLVWFKRHIQDEQLENDKNNMN